MNTDVLCQLKSLWQTVFQEPMEAIDAFFATAFSPDRCHYLMEDGSLVSALYWLDCEYQGGKLAYIYAVATHPDHRGKGLASRLLQETHAHLKALGYAGAVLKPAEGLFPFYARLGYVTSGSIRRFFAEADNTPTPLTRLSKEEFRRLRRTFLPQDAVVQEGATLDFLDTFASFYATDKALVCVAKQEPIVCEYLGDPAAAPGILAALGIQSAQLPTPGDEIPFTMFYPLHCASLPGYLGLPLE